MTSPTKTKKEIRFIGLQRSGNHALINWIIRQSGQNTLFYNDVEPENPFDSARLCHSPNTNAKIDTYDLIIYSYEDRILNVITDSVYHPNKNNHCIIAEKRFDVIIIRNPFNNFASRLKHAAVSMTKSTYISGLSMPQLWITYANEFLNKTNHLNNNKVTINYDLWCMSADYRKKIADLLELDFSDNGFDEITSYGNGSSFTATSYNKRAEKMKTDQRWNHFTENNEYIKLFSDKLLIDLAQSIFTLDEKLMDFVKNKIHPNLSIQSAIVRRIAITLLPPLITKARKSPMIRNIYFSYLQPKRKQSVTKS